MTISVRLNEKDTELIKAYASINNISLSDLPNLGFKLSGTVTVACFGSKQTV